MNTNRSHAASDAIDNRIDRALAGLNDAQPRFGLNGRILASLQDRTAHRTTHSTASPGGPPFLSVTGRSSARGKLGGSAHLALWATTSVAILAIASLAILHHSAPTKNTVILSEAPHRSAESKAGSPASVLCSMGCKDPDSLRPATNAKPFSTTNFTRTHILSSRPERVARSGETRISDHQVELATDLDAQALSDLHAPSHPAPPLPLTPQEKLFLRMLRYGNATQLAELNPLVRAQQDADETAAFKAFFPDPPPLEQPLGDTE